MRSTDRRTFLKTSALAGAGLALAPAAFGAPTILTPRRTRLRTAAGTLRFEPHFVQRGTGPHLADFAFATDTKWDAFRSNIEATDAGVTISDTAGEERFGIDVRWNVEDVGWLFLTADNGGDYYTLPPEGQTRSLNLNIELAKSRVMRNRRRLPQLRASGWQPTREVQALVDLSEGLYEDAGRVSGEERKGALAQQALAYAVRASEAMELEAARHAISRRGTRDDFFVGCDARSYYQMDPDLFIDRFTELFDYATITYYLTTHTSGMPDFEPRRGAKNFASRDAIQQALRERGVTVEGRPLFWPHRWVTPDWLEGMSYDDVRRYVEDHVREVVGHYGDRMYAWEVVNEFHDWANMTQLTPEQTVEVTRLACDVAKDTAPNVHRLINNCCPFAEYVQVGEWSSGERAKYPQRTPWEFMRDLHEADVDFTISGVQMYFPGRDLQDTILLVERFEEFGRPVQLTEVGTTSGPSERSVKLGTVGFPEGPPEWHRHWDEDVQADWLEGLYTLGYSKPWIEAVNWYDFLDGQAYIPQGGLIRSTDGERKAAFHRLAELQAAWQAMGGQG